MEKCYICGEDIDDESQIFARSVTQFAHKKCQEQVDKNTLYEFVKELFHSSSVPPRALQQIEYYHNVMDFSYSGIQKALEYFYVIKGNPIEKAKEGCGIVPFIYNEAFSYFYKLNERNARNNEVNLNTKKVEITISKPKGQGMKKKKFTFLGE